MVSATTQPVLFGGAVFRRVNSGQAPWRRRHLVMRLPFPSHHLTTKKYRLSSFISKRPRAGYLVCNVGYLRSLFKAPLTLLLKIF